MIRPIEAFFAACPADAAHWLHSSGLLATLLRPCVAALPVPLLAAVYEADLEAEIALIYYLSVVARYVATGAAAAVLAALNDVLADAPADAVRAMYHANAGMGTPPVLLLRLLLRQMMDTFDSVGYSSASDWRRKLWVFALLGSFGRGADLPHALPLVWFPEVVNLADQVHYLYYPVALWLRPPSSSPSSLPPLLHQVLCEEEKTPPEGGSNGDGDGDGIGDADPDDGFPGAGGDGEEEGGGPLAAHYQSLLARDPVVATPLRQALWEKMAFVQASVGQEPFMEGLVAQLGPSVVGRVVGRYTAT